MLRQTLLALSALGGLLPASQLFAQNPVGEPPRVYGPEPVPYGPVGRRIGIFIPPIGRFGGFSADIGRGRVDIQVGPSGYGGYGAPPFGGVNISVHRPEIYYGPTEPYIYGGAYGPTTISPHPYLGCVGDDCDPEPVPSQLAPTPDPASGLPKPPDPDPQLKGPANHPTEPEETVVPRRIPGTNPAKPATPASPASGPQLPNLPPQSANPAPRFFPTSGGPRLIPPGFIPNNGFDVDRTVRPNAPTLPGDDPFGPTRPRTNPNEVPAT